MMCTRVCHLFFFFNDTAPTEISPLSLHAALPICPLGAEVPDLLHFLRREARLVDEHPPAVLFRLLEEVLLGTDRKSTRLNSSHANISYAVFCLKKKTESY